MIKARVLGTRLDVIGRTETLQFLTSWLSEPKPIRGKFVVTAYSEFYVAALRDEDFRRALESADLVVPDGVGPLAAVRYERSVSRINNSELKKLLAGIKIGFEILNHSVGETVPGVWLFIEIMRLAVESRRKVFLLGGYGDTAKRLTVMFTAKMPGLVIGYDPGAQTTGEMGGKFNEAVMEKINKFQPDVLFVAYGPVKQEKWIATNLPKLKLKVAIGVGGAFDELSGRVKVAPGWMNRMGLKWLWRLGQEPKRYKRIWNAVVVFPWKVFTWRNRG